MSNLALAVFFFFLHILPTVFAEDNSTVITTLELLPPPVLNNSSPDESLTFTGTPIDPESQTVELKRNITYENECDYRFRLIGLGLENRLDNLTEIEKGFITARDMRVTTVKALQNWQKDKSAILNSSYPLRRRGRSLSRRQGSSVSTIEASFLTLFSHAAAASYCPADEIKNWNCIPCRMSLFSDMQSVQSVTIEGRCGEVQSFIGFSPKFQAIVVSIRGSKNSGNWKCNLNFNKCNTGFSIGGKVHCGFQSAWKDMRQQVFANIKSITAPFWPSSSTHGYPVYFVGHSLGAAMATLAAVDWLDNEGGALGYTAPNIGLITYGSPRVFDQTAASNFGLQNFGLSIRGVHDQDPVPHLPPKFSEYRHVFKQIFQRDDEKRVTCNDNFRSEDSNCANSVLAISIADHFTYGGIAIGCRDSYAAVPEDVHCVNTNGDAITCSS